MHAAYASTSVPIHLSTTRLIIPVCTCVCICTAVTLFNSIFHNCVLFYNYADDDMYATVLLTYNMCKSKNLELPKPVDGVELYHELKVGI